MKELCPQCIFFKKCGFESQLENGDKETIQNNLQALKERIQRSNCPSKMEILKKIAKLEKQKFKNPNSNLIG